VSELLVAVPLPPSSSSSLSLSCILPLCLSLCRIGCLGRGSVIRLYVSVCRAFCSDEGLDLSAAFGSRTSDKESKVEES